MAIVVFLKVSIWVLGNLTGGLQSGLQTDERPWEGADERSSLLAAAAVGWVN
jgi:hypothetical protein